MNMAPASSPRFPALHAIFDGGAREAWLFGLVAALLVLARSAAFLAWGHIDFDSDQAIVGLMAKHLSELRTFPLFFYDQNYMLGVQAWFTAPFFWIARPSIAVLKAPLVLLNIVAALLLMRGVSGRLGLRPAVGFVAVLPFIVPTPVVAASFLQTLGSSGVEPILYVLFLWMLRSRPFTFGALLVFGFLHREFTMYAVPALAVIYAADRSAWTAEAPRWLLRMAGGFGLVWLIIDDLRLHLEGLSLVSQAQMLGAHACMEVGQLPGRIRYVLETALPVLSGGTTMTLNTYGLRSSAVVGSGAIGWVVFGALTAILLRLAWLRRPTGAEPDARFGVYLALVGCCALAAYSLTCTLAIDANPTVRYVNLALLVPIGCFAAFMAREPSARWRTAAVVVFVLWGSANLVDNARVIREASVNPEPDPHRELTEFLLSRQIRYARANYWDAYVVDFLSAERVIVASFGPARIPEYERDVNANRDAAVHIERMPCEGWTEVARWCIQLPVRLPDEGPR
jgi:hypothetical protein